MLRGINESCFKCLPWTYRRAKEPNAQGHNISVPSYPVCVCVCVCVCVFHNGAPEEQSVQEKGLCDAEGWGRLLQARGRRCKEEA